MDVPAHLAPWDHPVTAPPDLCVTACTQTLPTALSACFHHTQCEQSTRKGHNFGVNQPLFHTGDNSGTAILSLIVLFHKKNTSPSINLCCESTGSSICQKSNYWLFPAYSFCGCSWSVCFFLIRAKVTTQLLSSAFPENSNIPTISTTSGRKHQKEWLLSEGSSLIRIPYFSNLDASHQSNHLHLQSSHWLCLSRNLCQLLLAHLGLEEK